MKNKFFCILCSICMLQAVLLSGCKSGDDGRGYAFSAALPGNPTCLDPQFTDDPNAPTVILNIMEGLMRTLPDGTVTEGEAESYTVSEDGLTYMFNLRKDLYWYQDGTKKEDAIPVTALDYVFAFERMFDPETRSPYREEFSCIKNGEAILAGAANYTELGVSAPDKETVLFQLDKPDPEFLQLLALPCAVPCNAVFFEGTDGRYGLDVDTVLCNGPFCLESWNYDRYGSDNFITLYPSSLYYGKDDISPSRITLTILKSRDKADTCFLDGEADVLMTGIWHPEFERDKYTVQSGYTETLGLIFNPEKVILQNQKLRRALILGLNRSSAAGELGEDLALAGGIIPPEVQLLGRSYRELCADEPLMRAYAPEMAQELFREAMEETGLSGTDSLRILVSTEIGDTRALMAICQGWQDLLGSYIGIETVTPSEFSSRIAEGDYTLALYGLTAERGSCREFLEGFGEHAALFGFSSETYTGIMDELTSTTRLADALDIYSRAEQTALESDCFVPIFYKKHYLVYTADNTDVHGDLFTGAVDFRDAKHFE